MNLTAKNINRLGYASIIVMLVMLALLWLRIVPDSFTIPFFVIALVLFAVRLILRVRLAKIERQALKEQKPEHAAHR